MGLERRSRADQGQSGANPPGEEPRARPEPKVKSFEIDKRLIVEAWEKVRANNGAPSVDAVGIGLFQEQLRDNLFKLWNRMSSGSYFPGPVRAWRYLRIRRKASVARNSHGTRKLPGRAGIVRFRNRLSR